MASVLSRLVHSNETVKAALAANDVDVLAALCSATPGMPIWQQSECVRIAARHVVDKAGGMVSGYYDGELQVCLPADFWARLDLKRTLRRLGWREEIGCRYRYPCDADTPASMRVDRGYFLCTRFAAGLNR